MADRVNQSTLNGSLQTIVGREISSIEFVRDYIILHFDGPAISCFVDPVVRNNKTHEVGSPGYRDILCEQIGTTVKSVEFSDNKELRLFLSNENFITVSLHPDDRTIPEALEFVSETYWWVL